MRLSISNSRAGFWIFGLIGLTLLVGPVEFAIRKVEVAFGTKARFTYPANDVQKLDWTLDHFAKPRQLSTVVTGNSQCEYGIDPATLGQNSYNLTFSGSSFLTGIRLISLLNLAPETVLVCISPADLTQAMVDRGNQISAEALTRTGATPGESLRDLVSRTQTTIDGRVEDGLVALLRSADRHYRRLLSDYLSLSRVGALPHDMEGWGRFFTSGQTSRPQVDARYYTARFDRGFLGLTMTRPWNERDFTDGAYLPVIANYRATVFPDYNANSERYWQRAEELLAALKHTGTRIVLIRMPVAKDFADIEDQATGFSKRLAAFAEKLDVRTIDGSELVPGFVTNVSNFRDAVHLHQQSADVFAEKLAQELRRGHSR